MPEGSARWLAERHGLSFAAVVQQAARNAELVANFDRLTGSNLSLRGSRLDLLIDQSSGRLDAELERFVQFVWHAIFLRF